MNKFNQHTIQLYLQGQLDPQAAHELEKQALDDPLLADAIDGFSSHLIDDIQLSLLQKQLEQRIAKQQEIKNIQGFTWQRLSVAAAAGLLFISASILFWMKGQNNNKDGIVSQKRVEVTLTDADSLVKQVQNDKPAVIPKNPPVTAKGALYPESKAKHASPRIAANTSRDIDTVISSSPALTTRTYAAKTAQSFADQESADTLAAPANGWVGYRQYLDSNKKLPEGEKATGKVIVAFTVNSSGILDNFEIVQGISETLDHEALRLIKEGPAWKPASNSKDSKVTVTVIF